MKSRRLSASERRESILSAAAPLFAAHGPHGVSTRELAAAAGVSEALLYRHFKNKNDLYAAVSDNHLQGGEAVLPEELPPSTRRLIISTHRLAEVAYDSTSELPTRQMVQSLLDDGTQARKRLEHYNRKLLPLLRDDLKAAELAGDLVAPATDVELWLSHHLLLALQLVSLPERAPMDYRRPRFELLARSVRFTLRGIGVSEDAINRDYRPDTFPPPTLA